MFLNPRSDLTLSPMFPLNMVVFPGSMFNLRIFEHRYLKMVNDCVEMNAEFGVCLIEKGHEVGGGDERYQYGTLSTILEVSNIGSGQLLIRCVGEKRLRVIKWHSSQIYPQAFIEISEVEDSGSITSEHLKKMRLILDRTSRNLSELTGHEIHKIPPSADTTIETIYHLAEHSYLGPYDRYQLLAAQTLEDRFALLDELLNGIDEIYANELRVQKESK